MLVIPKKFKVMILCPNICSHGIVPCVTLLYIRSIINWKYGYANPNRLIHGACAKKLLEFSKADLI